MGLTLNENFNYTLVYVIFSGCHGGGTAGARLYVSSRAADSL